jgi:hypothetical protein
MIMRKVYRILLLILSVGIFNSCLIENETDLDLNDKGPNLASFEQNRTSFSAIADGDEYKFDVKMKVIGPTSMDIKNDITLTVAVDPSSTAVVGKHFRLDSPTLTLSAANNLLGLFPVTMLTKGIVTPLAVAPVLVLKVSQASGDDNIVNNGKTISINLNYACPSFLEGTYDVTTIYTTAAGAVSTLNWTETITNTGIGEYRTGRVGHWTPADLGGTPGYTFNDVCGQISVSGQNLVDLYSNWVEGTAFGSVDPVTGNLYIEYSVCTAAGCRTYKSTYVKQ